MAGSRQTVRRNSVVVSSYQAVREVRRNLMQSKDNRSGWPGKLHPG